MRPIVLIFACAILAGCATAPDTKKSAAESLQPRPITHVKSEPVDIPARLIEAQAAFEARNFAQSYNLFGAVLVLKPGLTDARLGQGNAALALGDVDAAYKAFSNIPPEAIPEADKLTLLAGLALLSAEDATPEQTETQLKHVLHFAPRDARLWNALGRHYDRNGAWVDSAEAYVRALAAGNTRGSMINNLGMSLLMQGRTDAAMDKFEQAIQIEPQTALFDNNRRLVLALRGDYDAAISGLDEDRAALLCNDAGYIAMQRGNTGLARQLLERSVAINPVYSAQTEANLNAL